MDFFAIGDIVTDTFIKLDPAYARVTCDVHKEHCELSMHFGDKVPYESATYVPGVGNSANAAVGAARLGLSSGILTWVGRDRAGEECVASLMKNPVSTDWVATEADKSTNNHYVLWDPPDRTILIKHECYSYAFPQNFPAARAVYLSSLGEAGLPLHDALADWLEAHPDVLFAFQPGTFQMLAGMDRLKRLYARANVFFANKEEFQRILASTEEDEKKLMDLMREKGPNIVFLTDGGNGAYARSDDGAWKIGVYPDGRKPYDRTGAGDAFASTATVALLLGKSVPEALQCGPVNSMSVVQEIGAQKGLITRERLEQYLAEKPEYQPQAI